MAKSAILIGHEIVVPIMASETGRHADMGAMTSNTIAIMSTDRFTGQLDFNRLMTSGTDLSRILKFGDIIFKWLVRVMTIGAPRSCEMRIISGTVTTGAFRNRIICRWVRLVTIDTAQLLVSAASRLQIFDSLLVTTRANR